MEDFGLGGYLLVKSGDLFHARYTVIRKLGRGANSTVWLCSDKQDAQLKALKIARCGRGMPASVNEEIRLLKCVNSAADGKIVQLLHNFTIPGINGDHICMVFELLGASLATLIDKSAPRGFPIPIVKNVMRQVLEGLDFLHTKCNIIHTDIKPENICVGRNDTQKLVKWKVEAVSEVSVKIVDLGRACLVDRHTHDLIQACCYRSPEVMLGVGYGPNADVWSAACTAFSLATGDCLFGSHVDESPEEDEKHLAEIVQLLGDTALQMVFRAKFPSFWKDEQPGYGLVQLLTNKFEWNVEEAQQFGDFLLPMFAVNPKNRSSAMESLGHQWLQF